MDLSGWLAQLSLDELRFLARLLTAGRIDPGDGEALLRSYGAPESWAGPLRALAARGWTAALLAEAVSATVARASTAPAVSVVSTRPRGDGPEIVDTSVTVRQLFKQAEREVLIAGFRVTEREMLEPLRREAWRPLDVRLFVDLDPAIDALGRKQPRAAVADCPGAWWSQFMAGVWPTYMEPPRAWYAPATLGPDATGLWRSMHVKSVVVDRRFWFVTSANFTQRGHYRNLELGALIDDRERAEEVVACFERWVGEGVFAPVPGSGPT